MPKETFIKLNKTKKHMIEAALIKEFSEKPLDLATVKNIVETIGIPRGSFYQYFDSLQESYFYILDKQANGLHTLFVDLVKSHNGNIASALKEYENLLIQEVFDEQKYQLYRNRYLNWNMKLETNWRKYVVVSDDVNFLKQREILHFVKGVIHTLMQRLFEENWTKPEFSKKYQQYIGWLTKGINYDEFI